MANNGYKITPKIQQVFTTGPNSGSEVSSSFNIEFDVSSSFTSSIKCNGDLFNYRVFDPIECEIDNYCVSPSITNAVPTSCVINNYTSKYNISYNINNTTSSIPDGVIQYCLRSSFTNSDIGSELILYTSSIDNIQIDISDLDVLPLNAYTPVYFRIINNCSIFPFTSSYSNVFEAKCISTPPTQSVTYPIILNKTAISHGLCLSSIFYSSQSSNCNEDSFCGDIYYINTPTFELCTKLYNINTPFLLHAISGWYTNGIIRRYWTGSAFTFTVTCP